MYKEINYSDYSKELLGQLQKGAFLTVRNGERVNSMTIGWGALSFMWVKPVFIVMVRRSRFTHELIEGASDFTVSMPLNGQLKEALSVCGTKSGRDMDKIKECRLNLVESKKVSSPIIDDCDLHIECKIVYKHPLDENSLSAKIKNKAYSNGDYHDLYYGEIVSMYIKEKNE